MNKPFFKAPDQEEYEELLHVFEEESLYQFLSEREYLTSTYCADYEFGLVDYWNEARQLYVDYNEKAGIDTSVVELHEKLVERYKAIVTDYNVMGYETRAWILHDVAYNVMFCWYAILFVKNVDGCCESRLQEFLEYADTYTYEGGLPGPPGMLSSSGSHLPNDHKRLNSELPAAIMCEIVKDDLQIKCKSGQPIVGTHDPRRLLPLSQTVELEFLKRLLICAGCKPDECNNSDISRVLELITPYTFTGINKQKYTQEESIITDKDADDVEKLRSALEKIGIHVMDS